MEPFYLVWNPGGGPPTVRHDSEAAAVREAERLAREHPTMTFVVLETVCARRVDNMQRTELRPLPF